jgi:hypothetical protein
MFHLAGFFVSIGQTALTNVPPIQDDILSIQNSHYLLPQNMSVAAAYASSVTLSRARINSPTVRQINPSYIHPINVALLPANDPNVQIFPPGFLSLLGQEEVQIEATSGLAMGNENCYALLWLYTQMTPVIPNDIHWCRFTSTATATASAWTTISYSLETGLPPGEYAMVGSFVQGTTQIAHRWIFDNQYYRPGFLSTAALGNRGFFEQYRFSFGEMGRFRTFSLPRLQTLCNAADTACEGYAALMRVGA